MRTPLFHVFQNHDCQLYGRDTTDLLRKRDYERYSSQWSDPLRDCTSDYQEKSYRLALKEQEAMFLIPFTAEKLKRPSSA